MKYVSRPEMMDASEMVDAFEILQVTKLDLENEGSYALHLDNGNRSKASRAMCGGVTPAVGDFLVVQEDKHVYVSQRRIFLEKYRLIPNQKEE